MNNLKDKLFELSDEKYKKFHSGLCPNTDNIIGVRLPKLREIAKEIAKGDWRYFLATSSNDYYEEVMINGLVIAYSKCDVDEKLNYIESFVPKIDNWAICDSFCNSLKFVNKNKEKVWEFIQPYLKSNKEFEIIQLLSSNAGQVFDREKIYENIWGIDGNGDSVVIKEHIRKIIEFFKLNNRRFSPLREIKRELG